MTAHILLVSRDEALLERVPPLLTPLVVDCARSDVEARMHLAELELPPHLIIVDFVLPTSLVDGGRLLTEVVARYPAMRAVLLYPNDQVHDGAFHGELLSNSCPRGTNYLAREHVAERLGAFVGFLLDGGMGARIALTVSDITSSNRVLSVASTIDDGAEASVATDAAAGVAVMEGDVTDESYLDWTTPIEIPAAPFLEQPLTATPAAVEIPVLKTLIDEVIELVRSQSPSPLAAPLPTELVLGEPTPAAPARPKVVDPLGRRVASLPEVIATITVPREPHAIRDILIVVFTFIATLVLVMLGLHD